MMLSPTGGLRTYSVAIDRRLRLDVAAWGNVMRSTGPQRVALVLAVLALSIITYVALPPAVIKQAAALWGGG
jgi:hypothetical protein